MSDVKHNLMEVKNLHVQYTSNKKVIRAVNGVSFSIQPGKSLGLVGETGAGKTSVAKAILRILPDPPAKITKGEVILEGADLLKASENEMLRVRGGKISMIFQDPMTALNPVMTIGSQIAEAIITHIDISKRDAEELAVEMLNLVGIVAERYNEYPFQFSGGMKQRVVIAMGLACQPKLLLADEPTTALDVTIQAQIMEMINDLKHKLNTALVLITHDLGVVAETCDDVAVMYAGEIIEYGSKEEIFDFPKHPYTIGLFNSLPSFAIGESRLHPIDGLPPDPANLPDGCKFSLRCPYATDECRRGHIAETVLNENHWCRCIHPSERSTHS